MIRLSFDRIESIPINGLESRKISYLDHERDHTLLSFFIPVEREAEWLEDVGSQTVTSGGVPLAFLDKERDRIEIRLVVSPEDEEGALERNLEQRTNLVEQYAASVTEKIVEFNHTKAWRGEENAAVSRIEMGFSALKGDKI